MGREASSCLDYTLKGRLVFGTHLLIYPGLSLSVIS